MKKFNDNRESLAISYATDATDNKPSSYSTAKQCFLSGYEAGANEYYNRGYNAALLELQKLTSSMLKVQ